MEHLSIKRLVGTRATVGRAFKLRTSGSEYRLQEERYRRALAPAQPTPPHAPPHIDPAQSALWLRLMEQLIATVEGHPILYNKSHPDYVKTSVKDRIWATLAQELDFRDAMDIKEQWRKLRECHREALRRQYNKRRRGQGLSATKMWIYQKEMEFLLPFMTQRGPDTTMLEVSTEEEYTQQFKTEDSSEDQPSTSETSTTHQEQPQSRFRKRPRLEEQEAINLQEQARPEEDTRSHPVTDNDSLYHFFICMYNTTKNMPASTQLRVKKSIFDVVFEAEEELVDTSKELGVHHMV